MAGFRRRSPLGLGDQGSRPPDGIARGAGYQIAGPLGVAVELAGVPPGLGRAADTLDAAIGRPDGFSFALGVQSYRLRRRGPGSTPGEEPVPIKQAAAILEQAARGSGKGSPVSGDLARAARRLGQSPDQGDGLALFRLTPMSPTASSQPAQQPAQQAPAPAPKPAPQPAAKIAPRSWIEVRFLDQQDEPVPAGRFRIELPDKSVQEGTISSGGLLHLEGIDPGSCRISLLDLEKAEWSRG
jgi:hypothetical protein